MSIPTVSGLARQYLAGFEDDFDPKTLKESGLLSTAGVNTLGATAAANLAAQTAAMQAGFTLEQQEGINETALAVQELKNENAKKQAILNQLGGTTMAGTALSNFLSGGDSGFDLGSALSGIGNTSNQTQARGMPSDVGLILKKVDTLSTDGKAKLYKEVLEKFGKQL